MVRFPLPFVVGVALLCGFSSSASASYLVPEVTHPVVFGLDSGITLPGQTVHFTVTLSGPADGTEVIAVSANNAFSSIPTYLYPQAGDTTVGFSATLKWGLYLNPSVTVSQGDFSLSQVLSLLLPEDASALPVSTITDSLLP